MSNEELDYVYAEIKHHLENVLADERISAIIQMLKEYPTLKEKLEKINKVLEDVRMTGIPSCIDEHTTRMHHDLKTQIIV